jgi:riboflavin synthase
MFTGIVESMGEIQTVDRAGQNIRLWIASPLSGELSPDQSVCHDGVCLTVEETREGMHRVTAVAETLEKSTAGIWDKGYRINLERSLRLEERLDGHLVQGHVDGRIRCTGKKQREGSSEFRLSYPGRFSRFIIEKGSVCLNGVSLTAFDVRKKSFRVAIIPYTMDHTNFQFLEPGMELNVEFDLIGKYVARQME